MGVFYNKGFLKDLLNRNQYIHPVIGTRLDFVLKLTNAYIDKPQIIYKVDSNLYLQLLGGGRIYKLLPVTDSTYLYERIDKTINYNYNIGSYNFNYKGDLYNYGGYGFWKNHGNLIKFNWKDREWDIVPVSREIIPYFSLNGPSWFDEKEGKLFVPFESKVNAGVIGDENLTGIVSHYTWVLNLSNYNWEKLGKLTANAYEILKKAGTIISTDSGSIITSTFDVYFFNYKSNSILKSNNKTLVQSFSRMSNDKFSYYFNNRIYYNDANQRNYDSLEINLMQFEKLNYPIWQKENKVLTSFLYIAIGLAFITGFYIFFRSRNKKRIRPLLIKEDNADFKINFNDIEIALIDFLISKSENKKRATISNINYILGVKDKNVGLQKKVRSDVYNNINSKYKYYIKRDTQLIQSIRSEEDKRYFEYFIDESELKTIKSILKEYK